MIDWGLWKSPKGRRGGKEKVLTVDKTKVEKIIVKNRCDNTVKQERGAKNVEQSSTTTASHR